MILTDASSSRQSPVFRIASALDCRDVNCPYRGHGPRNPWRTTLLALARSNSCISELVMDPARTIGLSSTMSDLLASQLGVVIPWIRTLVNLQLKIKVDEDFDEFYTVHGNVSELLHEAANLECLALKLCGTITESKSRQLSPILGGCAFPKLRKLRLAGFRSDETELLQLLRGCPRTYKLDLDCYVLTSGTWEELISETRGALTLKEATFERLSGGSFKLGEDDEFTDYFDAVMNFFLDKGDNPFTEKAMEGYTERREVEGLEGIWMPKGIFDEGLE